jgi:hypothetical protein
MAALAVLLELAITADTVLDGVDANNDVLVTASNNALVITASNANGPLASDMVEITEMAVNTASNFGLSVKKPVKLTLMRLVIPPLPICPQRVTTRPAMLVRTTFLLSKC